MEQSGVTVLVKDRRKSSYRWFVLILSCISTIGDYYCFDNPGALHDDLKTRFLDYIKKDNFEFYFNLLYSLYALPNIILPFIFGILITKYGNRNMYNVLSILLILGQVIFTIGCYTYSMYTMLLGRMIFGFGGESLNITQNAMLIKWFYNNELSLPLGIALSIARMGNVINDVMSPIISSKVGITHALWTGTAICIFSYAATLLLNHVDEKADKEDGQSDLFEDENDVAQSSFNSISSLCYIFWLLTLLCGTLYASVLPFNNIATDFFLLTIFKNKDKESAKHSAGVYMSIPFLISAIFVPIFGHLIDKVGKRATLTLISSILGVISFFSFDFPEYINPLASLILLGFCYSVFASVLWPSVALVVDKKLVGLALGIMQSFQNLTLFISPIVVATIYSSTKSYNLVLFYFIILCLVAILFSLLLIFEDSRKNNILNSSNADDNISQIKKDSPNHTKVELGDTSDLQPEKKLSRSDNYGENIHAPIFNDESLKLKTSYDSI